MLLAHLEHYLNSNHQLQARVNLNGQMFAAGQLQAMPPKSEIRFMAQFAETNDYQQMPRVEVGLRDWPSFDFVGTVGTTEIRQHFSIETFRSEVNRVLGQYRDMQVAHAAQQFPVGNAQA